MATFYTADPHYGHEAIIRSCNRPFSSAEEMDREMIARHNDVVGNSDDVYIIGDFGIRDRKYLEWVFRRLNGRKHLIIGNHDGKEATRLAWSSQPKDRREVKDDGKTIVLDHYAMRTWNKMLWGSFHFFGHSHGKLPGFGRSCDVGVDTWDFRPVTADQVIARMMERNADFNDYVAPSVKGDEVSVDSAAVFGFGR